MCHCSPTTRPRDSIKPSASAPQPKDRRLSSLPLTFSLLILATLIYLPQDQIGPNRRFFLVLSLWRSSGALFRSNRPTVLHPDFADKKNKQFATSLPMSRPWKPYVPPALVGLFSFALLRSFFEPIWDAVCSVYCQMPHWGLSLKRVI